MWSGHEARYGAVDSPLGEPRGRNPRVEPAYAGEGRRRAAGAVDGGSRLETRESQTRRSNSEVGHAQKKNSEVGLGLVLGFFCLKSYMRLSCVFVRLGALSCNS